MMSLGYVFLGHAVAWGLYLIGAGDDLGEPAILLVLALHNGFDDAGVIGT